MYKKIITVFAVSLVMGNAYAQSSVTLSGIIDGGLSFTNGVGATDKNQWAYGQANLVVSRLIFWGRRTLGEERRHCSNLSPVFCRATGK